MTSNAERGILYAELSARRITDMGDKSPKKENKAQPKKDLKEKRRDKQEKKAAAKTWTP